MRRDILCYNPNCQNKVAEEETKKTDRPKRGHSLCPACKAVKDEKKRARLIAFNKGEQIRKANSERMTAHNPACGGGPKRVKPPKPPREVVLQKISDRMKSNNPMHNPEIAARAHATMKSRKHRYKRGPEHHLWRGNRDFNNTCRCQLYPIWTKPILERDGYRCVRCGTHEHLQVHHEHPLRAIIRRVREQHGIRSFTDIPSSEWQPYIDEVIALHKTEDGVTVCRDCHDEIDGFYNKPRAERAKHGEGEADFTVELLREFRKSLDRSEDRLSYRDAVGMSDWDKGRDSAIRRRNEWLRRMLKDYSPLKGQATEVETRQ
jgi:hypothetical protein